MLGDIDEKVPNVRKYSIGKGRVMHNIRNTG
jgi:hypothetical protein